MAMKLRVEWKVLHSTRRGNIFEKWFSCHPCTKMIIVDSESAFTSIRLVFYVDDRKIAWYFYCLVEYAYLSVVSFDLFMTARLSDVTVCFQLSFRQGRFLLPRFVAVFFSPFFSARIRNYFFPRSILLHFRYKISAFLRNLCLVCRRDSHRFVSHCLRAIVHACNRFPRVNRNSCRLIWINRLFRDLLVVLGRFMFSAL